MNIQAPSLMASPVDVAHADLANAVRFLAIDAVE